MLAIVRCTNRQQRTAMYSNVGKFEARKMVAEFDALLIQLYGRNMTDARISREEAIAVITNTDSVRKAVEHLGGQRGLVALRAA